MTAQPMIRRDSAERRQLEAELREHCALLAATPDRGYDSARKRAGIRKDIDALLELLNETL